MDYIPDEPRVTQQVPAAALFRIGLALIITVVMLFQPIGTPAQEAGEVLQRRIAELQVQKLQLEVAELQGRELPAWLIAVLGLLVGVVGTASSLWVARRTRFAALDKSVHDKRLATYPQLVNATAPLAVYFPASSSPGNSIGPKECAAMGETMSQWYFDGGGLLLSEPARDTYFRLIRALTRASLAKNIKAPNYPSHAEKISIAKLKEYRQQLGIRPDLGDNDVECWCFGNTTSSTSSKEGDEFRDYVFLQRLSSTLRSALTEDLRSRRRPL
jgi:hypothetical protein